MLYHFYLLFFFCLVVSSTKRKKKDDDDDSLLKRKLSYLQYTQCIHKRTSSSTDRISAKVVIAKHGADFTLPCFSCLSPEDALEIESVWKPSESLISKRLAGKMVDSIKQFAFRHEPKPPKPSNWKYEWEFMSSGSKRWIPLTHNHKKRTLLAKTLTILKAFIGRNNPHKISISDRYDLIMTNVSVRGPGWYRCINKYDNLHLLGSIYYIEPRISDDKDEIMQFMNYTKVIMINGTMEEKLSENLDNTSSFVPITKEIESIRNSNNKEKTILKGALSIKYMTSDWSLCSICMKNESRSIMGERRRKHECIVKRLANVHQLPPSLSIFRIFDVIPCRSSLLPAEVSNEIKHTKLVVHEVEECKTTCLMRQPKSRILKGLDSMGATKVLDYLPVGEYLLSEVLPPLRRPVKRKSLGIFEGDSIVFSCGLLPHELIGVQWSIDGLTLTTNNITRMYSNRALVDENNDFAFRSVQIDDAGKYSCHSDEGELLSAFSLFVKPNDRTQQITENIKMAVRFAAFLLIFLLIIKQLLK